MQVLPPSDVKSKLSDGSTWSSGATKSSDYSNGRTAAILISKDEHEGWRETVEITKNRQFMKEIHAGIRSLRRIKKRFMIQELFAD